MLNNQNQSKKNYFNLNLDGVGYLNRIEWLTPEQGDPYLVATINSIVGPENKTWYTRFDCTVANTAREDLEFIAEFIAQVAMDAKDAKVFVAFRAGDLKLSTFVHQSGKNAGMTGVAARIRLISLGYCTIDGQEVELPSQVAKAQAELPVPEVPAMNASSGAMPPPFVHPDSVPPLPPRAVSVVPAARSASQPTQRSQAPVKPGFGARFGKSVGSRT
jgi:hypothetical protein